MPEIWKSIADGITNLETESAAESEWIEASESSEPVTTVSQALFLANRLDMPRTQRKEISDAFGTSATVRHFGFECDFHALAFFDRHGKAWKVIKW